MSRRDRSAPDRPRLLICIGRYTVVLMKADLIAQQDVAARFDLAAGQWDSNPMRIARAKAVAEAIRQALPLRNDMQVLDFGAGTGLLTLALRPYVGVITAADASKEMLHVMEGKMSALKISSVHTLPEVAFDLVVSSMVLHHIKDVPAVLVRLRHCVRPDGWIALADLDTEDGSFHSDHTGVYHCGFDRRVMCAWLEQAGFGKAEARDACCFDRDGRQYSLFLVTGRA